MIAATPFAAEPMSLSDEELVARVRGGEAQLFELLMRRHNAMIYRAARAIVKDELEAEDVMQEAYVNAFAHLDDFEGRAKFSTWMTRIAVHEALSRRKRTAQMNPLGTGSDDESGELPAPANTPEDMAARQELAKLIEGAVDELPEPFRIVFMLRAVQEMSVAETAECLQIPVETVKTRLFRARGLLQKALLTRADSATPQAFQFHLSRCDRVVRGVLQRIGNGQNAS